MPKWSRESGQDKMITGLAVGFIGVLSLFNLYLTLAVVKYLRREDERINRRTAPVKTVNSGLLKPGTQVPEFETVTVSGEARSLSSMTGAPSLIAFFSVHCPSCVRQAPEFREYAIAQGYAEAHVLAVIISPEHEGAAELRQELVYALPVVVEQPRGTVSSAFSVSSYPAIFALDEHGRVQDSDITVRNISVPPIGRESDLKDRYVARGAEVGLPAAGAASLAARPRQATACRWLSLGCLAGRIGGHAG